MTAKEHYYTHVLANGLRIILQKTTSEVSYCGFAINAGTRDEDREQPGMAHFVEHMLFKGTARRRAWHIINRMERVGGELDAFTNKEETVVYSVFLKPHLRRALDLVADLVFHSTFPQREIPRETEVIIDEIKSYEDSPSELIYDEFENLLFSGHPLGRNILGDPKRLRTYQTADAQQFFARLYHPSNMVLFVQGNYNMKQVIKATEDIALGIPASGSRQVREQPHLYVPQQLRVKRRTHQAHVMAGSRAYDGKHPRRMALWMLNNILGGPGMNSRLNLQLREKRGLVYDVESNVTFYTDTGNFCIYFGCDKEDVDNCLELTMEELRKLRETRLTDLQLMAVKKQLIGQIGVANANMESNALGMAKAFLHYGRCVTSDEEYRRISAVTSSELMEVANEVFAPDGLTTLVYC